MHAFAVYCRISAKVESYFHQGDDDDVADNMGAYDDDVGLVPKKVSEVRILVIKRARVAA